MTPLTRLASMILVGLTGFGSAPAQPQPKASATGQVEFGAARLEALLNVLEVRDPGRDREAAGTLFAEPLVEHYGVNGILDLLGQIREELERFTVDRIESDGLYSAQAILRAESGEQQRFRLETVPAAPHGIIGFSLKAYDPEGELGDVPVFYTLAEADAFLEDAAARGAFSGAVLVDRPGHELFERAYGLADRDEQRPNDSTTQFDVGSITKRFTQVAILQLTETGTLGLDDPLGRWVEAIPAEIADQVTLRQLLRHESGYGDYTTTGAYEEAHASLRTIDDHLVLVAGLDLETEPGSARRYSNTGYLLLGAVIEAASDLSYEEYVRANIFEPAGMEASSFPDVQALPDDAAVGYTEMVADDTEGDGPNTEVVRPVGQSDGGSYSSARDLWLFAGALRENRLLTEPMTLLLMGGFGEPASSLSSGSASLEERPGSRPPCATTTGTGSRWWCWPIGTSRSPSPSASGSSISSEGVSPADPGAWTAAADAIPCHPSSTGVGE